MNADIGTSMAPPNNAAAGDMPTQTSPRVTLTADQVRSIFPDDSNPQSGEVVTLTLTAGEVGQSGDQDFDVTDVDKQGQPPDAEDSSGDNQDDGDAEAEAEKKMLGYDRKADEKRRKSRPSAPVDMGSFKS